MPKPFSETERGLQRIGHVLEAISDIREALDGATLQDIMKDRIRRAAFERLLEIISEASRHIPEEWRAQDGPMIPWKAIANLGNVIRHTYMHVELTTLWDIYKNDLDPLQLALDRMIARNGP
jgi:uncharacterized protein with HEPN domain